MICHHAPLESLPIISTLARKFSRPSDGWLASGAARTFTWVLATPSTGARVGAIVGGASVAEGRGVNVGIRVAVKNGGGVAVGVSAGDRPTEQPLSKRHRMERTRTLRMR